MTDVAKSSGTGVCAISGEERPLKQLVSLETLRPQLVDRILRDYPALAHDVMIDRDLLTSYRTLYVEELLVAERGEVGKLERQVTQSIERQETIAANVEQEFEGQRSFGEQLSDQMASFGGSWAFLITFFFLMLVWILINLARGTAAFDPFPFILLNLALSCLAAIQAPIIMMSQKRQEAKDRLRSLNDYRVNLKAELEIRQLHEKIDHLITKQWQRLAEIQQIQLEIMQESRRRG